MTFIVILIALLIERFFDWSHLRQWSWFVNYQQTIAKRISTNLHYSPYATLILTIIPMLLIILLVQLIIGNLLYGFIQLLFQLFILLYCLGPQNLWANTFACIHSLMQDDPHVAADKFKALFGQSDNLLDNIFIEANRRVFAVIFWFLILGPLGAVLYRMVVLSVTENASFSHSARIVETVLNWLPARIFTFVFALGGHFSHVLSCWRNKVLQGLSSSETLLTECGIAALGNDVHGEMVADGSQEKNAVSLLDRSFVIILVAIAVGVFLM